jgi:phosphoribosyl 1,2-cyclic phosphodiesterase
MIKFCVLGSGSKGNAIYFNVDGRQFLIDCGFTKKETAKRLELIGKEIKDIEKVFVTHDHGDHSAPWIKTDGLLDQWCHNKGFGFQTQGLWVQSFPLSHDSGSGSVGYIIRDIDENKIAVLMDTGCVPEEALGQMFDCAAILIETNYSVEMLINSPYPTDLQERIASDVGHLRDECAAEAVEMVAWPGLKYVVAMHLSNNCINPVLAKFELESALRDSPGCEVVISDQKKISKMMVIM